MALQHSSVVEATVSEVFAWHARPGAILRLSPPWQPVRVVREAESLRDGQAVLAWPGGLRWRAAHQPHLYDPPHRFVDELVSWPLRRVLRWRHTHEFTAVDERTRVTDRIDTPAPARLLRPMFVYRHRQLADDLAAHRWARHEHERPLFVALAGQGVLVSALAALLTTGGHRVVHLSDGAAGSWPKLLAGVDGVIDMRALGSPGTGALAELAAEAKARVVVVASSIGIYGSGRGARWCDETSPSGSGTLAQNLAMRESQSAPAAEAGLRVVCVRAGHVQSARTGLLRTLRPALAGGLRGVDWLSWIGLDDLLDVYYRALVDSRLRGPVNAVTPEPVDGAEYARTLAAVRRRPALGDHGVPTTVTSRRVSPAVLLQRGHPFRHPLLSEVFRHELGRV